jgi:hypothetical protein
MNEAPRKFTLLSDDNASHHPAGTVCYEFFGHDYGCCREDTEATGREFITLTLNADGSGPFFTCPCDSLEPRPMGTYMTHKRSA